MRNRLSLLWLNKQHETFQMTDAEIEELNIAEVFSMYSKDRSFLHLLKEVPCNIDDITYRQAILEEFVDNRNLLEVIKASVSSCHDIYHRDSFEFEKEATVYNLLNRIERVKTVMEIIEKMYRVLSDSKVKSKGLVKLKIEIEKSIEHPLYNSFKKDVAEIKAIGIVRSLKVGINLDENLRPVSALLLSFQDKPIKYTRHVRNNDSCASNQEFNSIEKMLQPAARQLIAFCDQFMEGLVAVQAGLNEELPFYEMGVKLYDVLRQAGFYLCQPLIFERGKTIIDSAYNVNLAFKMIREGKSVENMVYNPFSTEQEGSIHILTGANRGGKTTFTQAIGQIYWFAQMGYFVPAKKAAIKVVDGIFFHFPSLEEVTENHGRFGYDCKQFAQVFNRLTANSILLMNESFSGTSHIESLTVSYEIVKALQEKSVTTLFNTHLHELGRLIMALNDEDRNKTRCISLVTGSEAEHQSFQVLEGEPLGHSYAQDIAIQYGLTFEQLVRDDRLRKAASTM